MWQPIETAPKDGSKILFLFPCGAAESGEWVDAEPDYPDQMGHDAGWQSDAGSCWPGRSFGNPEYFSEPNNPPMFWMPLEPYPECED